MVCIDLVEWIVCVVYDLCNGCVLFVFDFVFVILIGFVFVMIV